MKSNSFSNSGKIIYCSLIVLTVFITANINAQDTPIENKKRVEIGVLTGYGFYSNSLNNLSGDTDVLEYSAQKGATGIRYITLDATFPIHRNFYLFSSISFSEIDFAYQYLHKNQMTINGSEELLHGGNLSLSSFFPQVGFSVAKNFSSKSRLALKVGLGMSILANKDIDYDGSNGFLENRRLLPGDKVYAKVDKNSYQNRPFTSFSLEYVFVLSSNFFFKANMGYFHSFGSSIVGIEAGNYVASIEESKSVNFDLDFKKVVAQLGIGYAF